MFIVCALDGWWATVDGLSAEEVKARVLDKELVALIRQTEGRVGEDRKRIEKLVDERVLQMAPNIVAEQKRIWGNRMPMLGVQEVPKQTAVMVVRNEDKFGELAKAIDDRLVFVAKE